MSSSTNDLRGAQAGLFGIVSGGQTGVDRAALDAALALNMPCGGWCPRGRLAEDGQIPARYPLVETPSDDVAQRTEWNVRDCDAVLVLFRGKLEMDVPMSLGALDPGTQLTVDLARRERKDLLCLDVNDASALVTLATWLKKRPGIRLDVAGPRESNAPGIYTAARDLLMSAWRPLVQ